MKRFRITAALSLALTPLPVGAFADNPETAPPSVAPVGILPTKAEGDVAVPEEVTKPTLDLVFCIDVSGSMGGYMPVVKATIQSLIRRNMRQYPGHTVRLGLVRYGDGAKRYFVLDLSEDQTRFLENLQGTHSDAVGLEFVGDVIKKSTEQLTWSENSVRKLYVVGNETAFQGPVGVEDATKVAHDKSVTVSAAYCAFPAGSSQGSDRLDVRNWFGSEWSIKRSWIDVARLGGGEFLQIVSQRGNILSDPQPLLAVAWEPDKALQFANYLTGVGALQGAIEQAQTKNLLQSLAGTKKFSLSDVSRTNLGPAEAGVMRYYDQNPQDAAYLLRL